MALWAAAAPKGGEQYVFGKDSDFATVCRSAGMDADHVRTRLLRLRDRSVMSADAGARRNWGSLSTRLWSRLPILRSLSLLEKCPQGREGPANVVFGDTCGGDGGHSATWHPRCKFFPVGEAGMSNDAHNLVGVLKAELEFLEKGGYRQPAWRPRLIFEDSPSCINYNDPDHSKPCSECPLMMLVPAESRKERYPCRHIPLNDQGETVDSLYRSATQEELETTVIHWLREEIRKLEANETKQGAGHQPAGKVPR